MDFFISDLHLGHVNCIIFDKRPFKDIYEMFEQIILKWNAKVSPTDTVYILGDLISNKKGLPFVNEFLQRTNGRKILIRGNHDIFVGHKSFDPSLLDGIYDYKRIFIDEYTVILSHYPIYVWERQNKGSIHLHGHVHLEEVAFKRYPALKGVPNMYNVGCMNWNYEPVTLKEILAVKSPLGIPPRQQFEEYIKQFED